MNTVKDIDDCSDVYEYGAMVTSEHFDQCLLRHRFIYRLLVRIEAKDAIESIVLGLIGRSLHFDRVLPVIDQDTDRILLLVLHL